MLKTAAYCSRFVPVINYVITYILVIISIPVIKYVLTYIFTINISYRAFPNLFQILIITITSDAVLIKVQDILFT